jgi:glycosyl transferase family 87
MPKKSTISRIYRLALAALVAGCLIFHIAILWESRKEIATGYGDFIIFYTGAQIINDGKAKELFKVETQNTYQAKFDVPQLEWPLPFNHAPYELFPFLPLARLSYPIAHAIWSGVSLIFLVIVLQILLLYTQSPHRFFIGAAVFAWFPTMETLRLGQDSIVSTLLLLAVFINVKRQRDGWAGFFLALGLYKPQLVLPMAGAFLVARRWGLLAAFSITGATLAGISVALVGWQGVVDFVSILRSMENYSYIIFPANMPNIRGLTHLLFHGGSLERISALMTLIVSIGLYALCLNFWRGKFDALDPSFDLKFSLVLVTTVLIGYHLYSHDLFPLTLSFILFFRGINSGSITDGALVKAFFILLVIFFVPVVPRYLIQIHLLGWGALLNLALYIILSLAIFRSKPLLPTV